MKTSSTRRSLIALARRILHSYFASSSLDLLLAYLAPDVVWLGAGRKMSAEGRQRVGDIFRASANRLIPCVMSQETYRAKELTEDLWLVEGSCQLRADSSYKVYSGISALYLHFHRQEALVPALSPLRRDQSDQPDP